MCCPSLNQTTSCSDAGIWGWICNLALCGFFCLIGFRVIFEALFGNVSYIRMPWNLIEAQLTQHSHQWDFLSNTSWAGHKWCMYAMVREQLARQRLSVEILLGPRHGPLLRVTLDMDFFLNAIYENSVFFFCDIISRQLASNIVLSHCMFSSRAWAASMSQSMSQLQSLMFSGLESISNRIKGQKPDVLLWSIICLCTWVNELGTSI